LQFTRKYGRPTSGFSGVRVTGPVRRRRASADFSVRA
jgi:hypothetical protein